jgi:homoserine O-acetyltransferase
MTDPARWPNYCDACATFHDVVFGSGQVLPELRLRYLTLGTPIQDASGKITNAVLLLHNTTGSADSWLQPSLADNLFGPGQALDVEQNYLIIPDGVGFGGSSKPSDGLRANFPNYRYVDMVELTHRLLTEILGIDHLRLILGVSMGGMQAWMWAEMYPDFTDAVVPIASQPGPMSGRNWIQRRVSIEAIRNDPEWNDGNYTQNPSRYVRTAPFSALMTQSVLRIQERAPTRQAADEYYEKLVARAQAGDANDRLYQVEASMDYDPSADIEKIKAHILAINFADDELNPPALGVMEPAISAIPNAEYVLIPAGPMSRGHLTSMVGAVWVPHLETFLTGLPG